MSALDLILVLVGGLTAPLGADDFATRERASATLAGLVAPDEGTCLLPLLAVLARHPDAEVAFRARRLLGEAESLGGRPWLDMLPTSYPDRQQVINAYFAQARELYGPADDADPQAWTVYRQATDLFVRDLVRSGKPRSEVRRLLKSMEVNEIAYQKRTTQ